MKRGLNYAPKPSVLPIDDIIAEIETGIRHLSEGGKQNIRRETEEIIRAARTEEHTLANQEYKRMNMLTKRLRDSDCMFMKSDKGRDLVIIDRADYTVKKSEVTGGRNFKIIERSPLNRIKVGLASVLKDIDKVFSGTKLRLMTPNPCVPKLYGLPKTYKPALKMRPIVSNIGSPTKKVVKWLVSEFKKYEQPIGHSVKNSFDFVENTSNLKIESCLF